MRQRRFSAVLPLLIIMSLFAALILPACADNTPTVAPTPTPTSESKIDTVLLGIILKYTTTEGGNDAKINAAITYARSIGVIDDKDQITFELELDDPTAQQPVTDKITTMGGKVTNTAKQDNVVKLRVVVPVNTLVTYSNQANQENFLSDLAAFKGVVGVNLVYQRKNQEFAGLPQTREALFQIGQQTKNQGVKIMEADKWQTAGFSGKGVKVGIIDGGFKYYEDLLGTFLPADFEPVDIDQEQGGDGVLDADVHGTAVSEIIHSVAPDAKLFPAAVDGSDDEISAALDYLVKQGVSIISMSMGGHGTSGNGDSFIEKKMNDLRTKNNILIVVSAGNEGDSHYVGYFDPAPDGYHQFVPGVTKLALGYPVRTGAPIDTYVILNWEQWLNGGVNPQANDLDLFIETSSGASKISSVGDQRSRPPREYVPLKLSPGELIYIRVRLKSGVAKPTKPFRLHIFTHNLPLQFATPTLAIGDPAAAKGVLAVGATDWDKDKIAYYSSQGPLPSGYFKPDISAPASVDSAAYQLEGEQDFPGTSAACPQVSGMAAVLKSANPGLTADQLATVVLEHTADKGAVGPDITYGYGRADLGNQPSANSAKPQNKLPPSPTPNLNPDITVGLSKYYPTPVKSPIATSGLKPTPAATSAQTSAPAAPTPTVEIPATPAPVASVNFEDNFKDISSGLPNAGATTYQSGKYTIRAGANQLAWGVYPTNKIQVDDFDLTVNVQGVSGDTGLYGLVFWHQSAKDYFMLSVSGGGGINISQFNNANWQELMPWTKASSWQTGKANTVRLVSTGGNLRVIINNSQVNQQPVKSSGFGAIGLAAGSYSGQLEASFSGLRLATR